MNLNDIDIAELIKSDVLFKLIRENTRINIDRGDTFCVDQDLVLALTGLTEYYNERISK